MATNMENSLIIPKKWDFKTLFSPIHPNIPSPKFIPPEIIFEPENPIIVNYPHEDAKSDV